MRVGVFSDAHLFSWKSFGVSGFTSGVPKRLQEQIDALRKVQGIFRVQDVDYTVFGGDWVHSVGTVQNEVLNVSREIVGDFSGLLVVDGNHDTPVRVSPKPVHIFTNIIRELSGNVGEVAGVKLVNYYDLVDYNALQGYDLVVLHKTPYGSKVGNYTFDEGVDWKRLAKVNKFVAFGHIHEKQALSENCFVIGAPYHLTFGDVGERGVFVVDTDRNTVEFFAIESPKFLTVEKDEDVRDDKNYYRVLNSKSRIEKENVVSVVKPQMFEERIKAESFYGILEEWLTLNGKDKNVLDVVKDLVDEKLQKVHSVFKGKLKRVGIENFGSIRSAEYGIRNGFTLVAGHADMFDSNGSGKSTLIGESIFWALFGATTKGLTGNEVIMRGEKDCSVSLELMDAEKDIIVSRTRRGGLVVRVLSDGKEVEVTEGMKQDDRQKYLEGEILGFDKNTFLASCYFSQENLVMLTGLSDIEKTNMITNLLGFECYENLYFAVKEKSDGLERKIRDIDLLVMGIERKRDLEQARLGTLKGLEGEVKLEQGNIDVKIDEELEKKMELKKQLSEVVVKEVDDTNYSTLKEQALAEEESLNKKVEGWHTEVNKLGLDRSKVVSAVEVLGTKINRSNADIAKIRVEISNLKTLKLGERCDKCGSVIASENVGLFVEDKEKRIKVLGEETVAWAKQVEEQEIELTNLDKYIEKLSTEKNAVLALALPKVRKQLQDIQQKEIQQIAMRKEADVVRGRFQAQIDSCDRMIKSYVASRDALEEKIEKVAKDIVASEAELEKVKAELDKASVDKQKLTVDIETLEFWRIAFSGKGIPAVLLDRFCNEFNSVVNIYLSQVSNGSMSIVLTPTKTTKGGEERNKIGMTISLGGIEVDYRSLSGGEKRRVDASLCFGLNSWIKMKHRLEYGLLGIVVLDEVFSFLDRAGEESIAQLLSEEGKSRAVFVIDHAVALEAYADKVWRVVKEGGISRLELELN